MTKSSAPSVSALAAPDGDPGPLTPAGTLSVEDQLAALSKQVAALLAIQQGNMQLMAGVMQATAPKLSDETLQAAALAEPLPEAKPVRRIKIMLEDNDNIPPGGQFISIDGVPYMLQPNYEVEVPINLLDVLDHAIQSVPITDENRNVIGYRDQRRFPYRVIRERESSRHEE